MSTTTPRRRLIEVAFPLDEVSKHSKLEKYYGEPHPQALHIWWARRPLAACRAFIYASLIDDPATDAERDELLKEIGDLAAWKAVREPDAVVRPKPEGSGLTGAELLRRARERILAANGGVPPRLLDPFAGGGAIPLEALRLGCEVEASDLNPVAVLILKGTVEYPQRYGRPLAEQRARHARGEQPTIAGVDGQLPAYITDAPTDQLSLLQPATTADVPLPSQGRGQGLGAQAAYAQNPLAADVRYWGDWMLERARAELAPYYPPDPDGAVPVAYLWSRTVPCPNCAAEMPLIRQYWLARKDKKKVALQPVVDRERKTVDFKVVEGANVSGDPAEATTSLGDILCLVCRQVVKGAQVREAARAGKMGATPTSVVLEAKGRGGKRYRADRCEDTAVCDAAQRRLQELIAASDGELPLIPDEPMPPRRNTTGGVITSFGIDQWGKLFNARQLLALTTFARLVREAHAAMLAAGLAGEYARAVATYLAFAADRIARENTTLTRWNPVGPKAQGALGMQGLPMVWDYAELNPFAGSVGDASTSLEICAKVIGFLATSLETCEPPNILQRNASLAGDIGFDVCTTDPPYYDSINYADLSDFFYVWLKRSIGHLYPTLMSVPLTPKREQAVMNVYSIDGETKAGARQRYLDAMASAFHAIGKGLRPHGIADVVFAHTDQEAWATLIEGLLDAELIPDASWPIDTEMENKAAGQGQARLKTSVWMACRPRDVDAGPAFLGDVLAEMEPVIRERLLYFWGQGIRGADFFISAIGPALSVFGRHSAVLRPDGSAVSVRDFLDLVRRKSTEVALQQVLHGADMGVVDPLTALYVAWVWSAGRAPLDTGDAIALCLATGADYKLAVRPNTIAAEFKEKSKKRVKLRPIAERGADDEELGAGTPARPAALIDQAQHAAWLWQQNRRADLARYRERLGDARWTALRTLAQAVAECLPEGDNDKRLFNGLLGTAIMAVNGGAPADAEPAEQGRLLDA